jgi:predicted nucleotidyltransferase
VKLKQTEYPEVLSVFLFGSRLHDCWTDGSDWDFMVWPFSDFAHIRC